METITNDTDLAALFGIEMDPGHDATLMPTAILCAKCHGRGNFFGYTGRIVGKCFACEGTGLAATAGVELALGTCTKCAGKGEWRPGRPCFGCNGTGKEVAIEITVGAIASAFAAAHAHGIKRPKLRLDTFVFSRAPDTGRNAGSIYVTQDGKYLGKITEGRFYAARECDDPTRGRVVAVASDPHAAAKAYGQRTGSCSCCGRELTDPQSIAAHVGPICAEKYGWAR
jgi:Family of unknown function (DUF6011)